MVLIQGTAVCDLWTSSNFHPLRKKMISLFILEVAESLGESLECSLSPTAENRAKSKSSFPTSATKVPERTPKGGRLPWLTVSKGSVPLDRASPL